MTPLVRITCCGLAGIVAYGCWVIGQVLAPGATSELSDHLRPYSAPLLVAAAGCLWVVDKLIGPLIERMSERYLIPSRVRREFLERTVVKLDELEAEVSKLTALAERAIAERDAYLMSATKYRNLYNSLLREYLNATAAAGQASASGHQYEADQL